MSSDTEDNVGNALMSFKKQVGVLDDIINNNNQNFLGSHTIWAKNCCDKDICHMLTGP